MCSAGWHRVPGVAALLLALAALVAVVLVVAWPRSHATRVNAGFGSLFPGIDFSIAVGTQCDSTVGPTICTFNPGDTFTLDMKLNHIPAFFATPPPPPPPTPPPPPGAPVPFAYDSYDAIVAFTGVNLIVASLVQTPPAPDVWPDCGAPGSQHQEGQLAAGCLEPIGASPSVYTGVLWHVNFQCPDTPTAATIALLNGPGTDVVDENLTAHGEDVGYESLTINCGNPPTATPTAGTPGLATPTPTLTRTPTLTPTATPTRTATPTPTPTITPTPTPTFTVTPTPTRRPNRTLMGDVDGDLSVDARDALWVLWFDAGIVADVPIPEAADVNGDGIVNARDALYILQFDAGVIELL
jgi:hypothetical protein